MPPDGCLSRNPRTGESAPSGSNSSILLFGSSTKTTVTPCSGKASGAETSAPSASLYLAAAAARSGTTIATWLSRPIIAKSSQGLQPHQLDLDQWALAKALVEPAAQHAAGKIAHRIVVMALRRRQALHRVGQRVAQRGNRLGVRLGQPDEADLWRRREPAPAVDDQGRNDAA